MADLLQLRKTQTIKGSLRDVRRLLDALEETIGSCTGKLAWGQWEGHAALLRSADSDAAYVASRTGPAIQLVTRMLELLTDADRIARARARTKAS